MSGTLRWDSDGLDWPHRDHSRFVKAGGLNWRVEQMGKGPTLLLLHGTGASAHSWHRVMHALSGRFTVVAPDLPLHVAAMASYSPIPTIAAGHWR
ncbi:MAG: alpha/beta fold hydrolase [Erythrobacter sp.]